MRMSSGEKNAFLLWLTEDASSAKIWQHGYSQQSDIVELPEDVAKKLDSISDRGGVRSLINEAASRHIALFSKSELTDSMIALMSVAEFVDPLKFAKGTLSVIESYPKDFIIFVRGPKFLSDAARSIKVSIKLNERFGIISSQNIKNEYSLFHANEIFTSLVWRYNDVKNKQFAENHLYFYFRIKGGIISPFGSRIMGEFMNELRAFYGIALAHELLFGYSERDSGPNPILLAIDSKEKILLHTAQLDSDLITATYFERGAKAKTRYMREQTLEAALFPVINFFRCNDARLKTSAMWLLRAKMSLREMDQVLETAIALEVLLGDRKMSDKVGLTRLMSNRCSYALGQSSVEREEIEDFFERFYGLRSKIVHTGRFEETDENEDLVWKGLDLLERLLVHEQNVVTSSLK